MRVEPDRQGHHSSEAPVCHRCRLPLLEESTFCPYCERWLDDTDPVRMERAGSLGLSGRSVSERTLLTAGIVFFGVLAAVCVALALVFA